MTQRCRILILVAIAIAFAMLLAAGRYLQQATLVPQPSKLPPVPTAPATQPPLTTVPPTTLPISWETEEI